MNVIISTNTLEEIQVSRYFHLPITTIQIFSLVVFFDWMSFKHNSSRGLQQKNHRLNTSNSAALLRHVSSTASRSTHCWKKQNRLSLNTNPSLHCVNQFRSRARHWPLQYAGHPGRVKEGSRGRGEWRTPAGSGARQSQVQPVAWRRLHKEKKTSSALLVPVAVRRTGEVTPVCARDHVVIKKKNTCGKKRKLNVKLDFDIERFLSCCLSLLQ